MDEPVVQTVVLTFTGIDRESFDRWILSLSGLPIRGKAVAYRQVHVGVGMQLNDGEVGAS